MSVQQECVGEQSLCAKYMAEKYGARRVSG